MKDNSQFYYRRALSDVMFALKDTGFEYFLYAGTLLGFVREGDIIPWDHDVDIMLHEKHLQDVKKMLQSEDFRSIEGVQWNRFVQRSAFKHRDEGLGYYAVMRRLKNSECKEFHNKKKGHTKCRETVDFYLYRESGSLIVPPPTKKMRRETWKPGMVGSRDDCGPQWREFARDMVYPIKDTVMQGIPVKIPHWPHAMLRKIYGEDYMTPNRDWVGGRGQAFPDGR